MLNSCADAIGILLPNSYDSMVPELVRERLMGAIPFAGSYRLVDFILSSMVNGDIENVSLVVKENYHSLMTHLGNGREWSPSGTGNINLIPPFANKDSIVYTGRVEAIYGIIPYLKDRREKYIVMSDVNLAVNFDFRDLLDKPIASGADVTAVYTQEAIPRDLAELPADTKNLYYTLDIKGNRVTKINVNSKKRGIQNLAMNIYAVDRERLIQQISEAHLQGSIYYERDILAKQMDELDVRGYCFEGYVARIGSLRSYFEENMKLLEAENEDALFGPNPVYTNSCDEDPTRYLSGASVKNVMAADGCRIDGEVENCILSCGVQIGKGARVKNCILMNDVVVEDGAVLEYVIADKKVIIHAGKELKGTDTFPVYVEKGRSV